MSNITINTKELVVTMSAKLESFNAHMQRIDKGIRLAGTCVRGEFYITATINADKATRKDYVMRASLDALKQYVPMVGMSNDTTLEWASYTTGLMADLDIELVSVVGTKYAKPAALGENQFYRTQWCKIIQRPTNAIYVDPRRLWIDVNSIVEI